MKRSAFIALLCMVPSLWAVDTVSAQRPAPQALSDAERTALAQHLIGFAQMAVQYALAPDDVPATWGPQQLLEEAARFGLSPEQRRALEALDARYEEIFFGMMSEAGPPDTTLLPLLWGPAPIDPADVTLAALRINDLETRAVLEFARIQDEMRALLTPEQRELYVQHTEEVRAAYAAMNLRSPEEAAAMLEQMADHGMLPHPLLLGRSRGSELGLSPSEQQRLDTLHGRLAEAVAVVRDMMQQEPELAHLSAVEVQAVLDTAPPAGYMIVFATELLRLRDEAYQPWTRTTPRPSWRSRQT